jgi:polysaccharide export outer membrane protein
MNDQSRVFSWAGAVCRWVLVLLMGCTGMFATQAALAASAASAPNEYRLGPGDILHVTVYQNPDLTLDTRVSESGMVSYPLLGSVKLGGLTVSEAERHIANGLRSGNFVKQPQVTVMVTQVHGNQASVLGQVNRPGRFPLEVGDLRLTDLLAMAGGIAPTGADEVTVVGTREGRPYRVQVDLPSLFGAGSRTQDIAVQNGDVIWVDRAPMVYVYGEVQRPGAIRLERGMTVMQALAASGGLTQRGTDRGMRVHRRIDGRMQEIQPKMDDPVQNGDVVYVRESIF